MIDSRNSIETQFCSSLFIFGNNRVKIGYRWIRRGISVDPVSTRPRPGQQTSSTDQFTDSDQVSDQMGDQVSDQMGDQVSDQMGDPIGDQTGGSGLNATKGLISRSPDHHRLLPNSQSFLCFSLLEL